jgi:hypothetical protein
MLDKLNPFKKKETKSFPNTTSAKEQATKKKEPYIEVINTHVNPDNIKNGFFELDWNEYFILELKETGYGFDGDPEEEIVDRWFRDIVTQMLQEEGGESAQTGYINIEPRNDGKSEVS